MHCPKNEFGFGFGFGCVCGCDIDTLFFIFNSKRKSAC